MSHYFNQVGGFNNKKKTYFLWTDVNKGDHGGDHGGDTGVGIGKIFFKSNGRYGDVMKHEKNLIIINLHELLHTQLMGIKCIKEMKTIHYTNQQDNKSGHQLSSNRTKLNRNLYTHNIEGCPQLINSIYLIPTSEGPYNPYEIMCERNLGKYTT